MEGFHRRYMVSRRVLQAWAAMVRTLDIEMIAPQHGAMFKGRELVERFISWCEGLDCGIDIMLDRYKVPAG
jgi:flavorubredoxin